MATNSPSIVSKTDRRKLAPRREPYWTRIAKGCHLGFRVLRAGEGTWIARWRDDDGKQHYRALGHFDEYDPARKMAEQWFAHNAQGATPRVTTVQAACEAYVEKLTTEKGKASARDAEGRFKRLVYETRFGRLPLDKVQTKDVRKWRDARLADIDDEDDEEIRRAKDTANRDLASLKAALNFALHERWVATDAGWKTVTAFRDVGGSRKHFLTGDQCSALLSNCPEDLRPLASALLLTGARPGEMANARASDFNKVAGTLVLDGKTGRRTVALSSEAIEYFATACRERIGDALIFARSDGSKWDKDAWKKLVKTAVAAAKLPADVVLYSLRHTRISRMVSGGMDIFTVGRLTGTSTAMIERHYGHLRHDQTRAKQDALAAH